jgi:hypothetical protein
VFPVVEGKAFRWLPNCDVVRSLLSLARASFHRLPIGPMAGALRSRHCLRGQLAIPCLLIYRIVRPFSLDHQNAPSEGTR